MKSRDGSWKVRGGVCPRIRSRITPPPTAVVRPRMMTPNTSMFFFTAVIAPEAEKASVPIISRTNMMVSKVQHLPCVRGGASSATCAGVSAPSSSLSVSQRRTSAGSKRPKNSSGGLSLRLPRPFPP